MFLRGAIGFRLELNTHYFRYPTLVPYDMETRCQFTSDIYILENMGKKQIDGNGV